MPRKTRIKFTLGDEERPADPTNGFIEVRGQALFIHVDGYTNGGEHDDVAAVIALEVRGGRLRLLAYTDRKSEAPTIIDMAKAAVWQRACKRCGGTGNAVHRGVEPTDEHCADCEGTGIIPCREGRRSAAR